MKGIFITGTDTGVGKTYIAAQLARALTLQGVNVIPRKPVESGCTKQDGELIPADALALKIAANYSGSLQQVCPHPFEPAISPALAAKLANHELRISALKSACLNGVSETDFLLVEGAGGFYSPLCADGLNADLAKALNLPVILVVEDRVGCINHCLLVLEAAQRRDIHIAAIVLNRINPAPPSMDNHSELAQHTACPIFPHSLNCDEFLKFVADCCTP